MEPTQKSKSTSRVLLGVIIVLGVAALGVYGLRTLYNDDTSTGSQNSSGEPTATVVATTPHVASWLNNILPDAVTVDVLASGEVHDFALTPQLIASTEHAVAIIANGAGLEPWLEEIKTAAPDVPIVETATEDIIVDNDPHTWLDPLLASQQVDRAAQSLAELLPAQSTAILQQASQYQRELDELDQRISALRDESGVDSFVAQHNAFGYFARRYGIEQVGTLVERPGDLTTFSDIENLSNAINEHQITTLFVEPGETSDTAQSLAQELNLDIVVLDPLESIEPTAEAYIAGMQKNAEVLFALQF